MGRMAKLEELVWDAIWPEDVVIDGKVMWQADDGFADLYLMNRMAGWEVGITQEGLKWLDDELKAAKTIVVFPTKVARSIERNIIKRYPDAAPMTLYQHERIDVETEIPKLEAVIEERVYRLPKDKTYILPFTGFCYATMVVRDYLIERGLRYKLLIFDSHAHKHFEIEDAVDAV